MATINETEHANPAPILVSLAMKPHVSVAHLSINSVQVIVFLVLPNVKPVTTLDIALVVLLGPSCQQEFAANVLLLATLAH